MRLVINYGFDAFDNIKYTIAYEYVWCNIQAQHISKIRKDLNRVTDQKSALNKKRPNVEHFLSIISDGARERT